MAKPLFSIIIPSYNRAHLIGETLESVLAQTCEDWECIVVDDGSSDNTEEVTLSHIEKDGRFRFYKRPEYLPKGANACRNFGFSKSKGKLINWLDSDDLLMPKHLSVHLNIHQQEAIDISVTEALLFDSENKEILRKWSQIRTKHNVLISMSENSISWPTNNVVWKKPSIYKIPFNEKLQSSQEWFLHMNSIIDRFTFECFKEATVLVRKHQKTVGNSRSPEKYYSTFTSRYLIFLKLRTLDCLTPELEKTLLKPMFESYRESLRKRYLRLNIYQYKTLWKLFFKANHKILIFRIIAFATPIFIITRRGEFLFKFKRYHA